MKHFIRIKKLIICTSIFISLCAVFAGCSKNKKQQIPEVSVEIQQEKANHTWYYFSKDNFIQIDKPQNSPFQNQTPWTEARRISSAVSITDVEDSSNQAFALVNRLGILSFQGEKITLTKDINLFSDRTADNLLLMNQTPIFSVYKSSFFNNTIKAPDYKNDNSQHLFLIQFDPSAKICYPVLNCTNLTDLENSEVIDFYWDGLNWTCSLKTISDSKNDFSYIKWKPITSLLNLSPGSAKENLSIEEINQDDFRKTKERLDYSAAPERIKNLLENFASEKSFELEIRNAGGSSPQKYLNDVTSFNEKTLIAKGILAKSWSSVLFEDGTLFMEGALPGKHILRNGKPIAIRLPKLPGGFVYSDYVISGTTLYAAWEERSFYNTARSGFLEVNLDKTLYSKIR